MLSWEGQRSPPSPLRDDVQRPPPHQPVPTQAGREGRGPEKERSQSPRGVGTPGALSIPSAPLGSLALAVLDHTHGAGQTVSGWSYYHQSQFENLIFKKESTGVWVLVVWVGVALSSTFFPLSLSLA